MNRTSLFFMLDSLSSCSSPQPEGCLLYVLELYPGSPLLFSSLTTHTHMQFAHPSIPTTTVATVVSASVFISQHNTQIHFTRIHPSIYPNNSSCKCGQRICFHFSAQHANPLHLDSSIHLSQQPLLQLCSNLHISCKKWSGGSLGEGVARETRFVSHLATISPPQ
jgi:hypothetical protein